VIGREKCILPTMMIMSNVHARKSFFFAPYRPNSPNKILGPESSIIVKMMDERRSDLPSNFSQFHFLPTSYIVQNIYYYTTARRRPLTFYFRAEGLFAVPTHCVRQKVRGLFFFIRPSRWAFISFQIFFLTEILVMSM